MPHIADRALGWFYSAVGILRPRSTTDRVLLAGATDDGCGTLQTLGPVTIQATPGGVAALVLVESVNNLTCATLTSAGGTLSAGGIYVKNNQLVIAHQCGANGQIRYLTITLDGLSCAWLQSATAP